jgi:hypothetical protein
MLLIIPTIMISDIFHIGKLNNKKRIFHEGNGLSITTHPKIWKNICFPLESSLYRYKKSPVEFVNVNAIKNNSKLLDFIFNWCLDNNFIQKQNVYIISYNDHDFGLTLTKTFIQIKELEKEGYSQDDIIKIEKYNTTTKLNKLLYEGSNVPVGLLSDFIVLAYILKNTDFKGAWWDDSINIKEYQAPRGVIFKEFINIKNFKIVKKHY